MDQEENKFRSKNILGASSLLLNVLLLSLIGFVVISAYNKFSEQKYISQNIISRNTINVSAEGEVSARPDLALIDFSVVTEAKTVEEAMTSNAEKMNKALEFIKGQGVEEKDLKTTNFSIYPRYDYYEIGSRLYPEGKRVLVGYEVSQTLEAKIRDLTKIGAIIEGATNEGVNQTGSLRFTIDNQDNLRNQARVEAINKAKQKARDLASQLGVSLGNIVSFSEGGTPGPIFYDVKSMEEAGIGGAAPDIQAGENEISVTVSITYEIR